MLHKLPPFLWLLLLVSAGLDGCSAERVAVGPSPPREQEIMRFRSTNPTKGPVLFGQVNLIDGTNTYILASAIVSLDKKVSFATAEGSYFLTVPPGSHQMMTGQVGVLHSVLTLHLKQGDSIRVNFHLRPDRRPLD